MPPLTQDAKSSFSPAAPRGRCRPTGATATTPSSASVVAVLADNRRVSAAPAAAAVLTQKYPTLRSPAYRASHMQSAQAVSPPLAATLGSTVRRLLPRRSERKAAPRAARQPQARVALVAPQAPVSAQKNTAAALAAMPADQTAAVVVAVRLVHKALAGTVALRVRMTVQPARAAPVVAARAAAARATTARRVRPTASMLAARAATTLPVLVRVPVATPAVQMAPLE